MRNSLVFRCFFFFVLAFAAGCENGKETNASDAAPQYSSDGEAPEADVEIQTEYGKIGIALYDDTPKHKASFLRLTRDGYFNGKTFFRVLQNLLIQAGGPPLKEPKYKPEDNYIESEISSDHFHKRGAVAAGRLPDERNPERLSTATHFYIVTGSVFQSDLLDSLEKDISQIQKDHAKLRLPLQPEFAWLKDPDLTRLKEANPQKYDSLNKTLQNAIKEVADFSFTPQQRETYATVGGVPSFDGQYTVFGEVVYGMEVVEIISKLEVKSGTNLTAVPPEIKVKVLSGELDAK